MQLLQLGLMFLLFLFPKSSDNKDNDRDRPSYSQSIEKISQRQSELANSWNDKRDAKLLEQAQDEIITSVEELSNYWLGTRWALGSPQTTRPQHGKVNCGTFVGRILHDVGFQVRVKKLQRQPSQLIIKSFVGGKRVRKFSNAPMKKFLASVREMGPGLYIIGLDFHVGLLLQTEDDLRFIHASYETETVVNEKAAIAMPITSSKYRVVGKILSPANIKSWLAGDKIVVKGSW
jgi:hypothetical protein